MEVRLSLEDILNIAAEEIYLDKDFEEKVYTTKQEFEDKIKHRRIY
jgi:hypothetical protein